MHYVIECVLITELMYRNALYQGRENQINMLLESREGSLQLQTNDKPNEIKRSLCFLQKMFLNV